LVEDPDELEDATVYRRILPFGTHFNHATGCPKRAAFEPREQDHGGLSVDIDRKAAEAALCLGGVARKLAAGAVAADKVLQVGEEHDAKIDHLASAVNVYVSATPPPSGAQGGLRLHCSDS
jgi:hypothetical protein